MTPGFPRFCISLSRRLPRPSHKYRGALRLGQTMSVLDTMTLPVSIRCKACSHHMPRDTSLTCVTRRTQCKSPVTDESVSYIFTCPKCPKRINLTESPENSGCYVVKYGATRIDETQTKLIVDEDDTSDSNLKRQKLMIVLPSDPEARGVHSM